MDEKTKVLYELCEIIHDKLDDAVEKLEQTDGRMSTADVDYIDKLTHALKSIKTTLAMMEADSDYSERGYSRNMGERSNARRPRDRMGRYKSYGDDTISTLHDLMTRERDPAMRQEMQSFINKLERM